MTPPSACAAIRAASCTPRPAKSFPLSNASASCTPMRISGANPSRRRSAKLRWIAIVHSTASAGASNTAKNPSPPPRCLTSEPLCAPGGRGSSGRAIASTADHSLVAHRRDELRRVDDVGEHEGAPNLTTDRGVADSIPEALGRFDVTRRTQVTEHRQGRVELDHRNLPVAGAHRELPRAAAAFARPRRARPRRATS